MNTQRKPSKIVQCSRCPNVYMITGQVPIGLAHPRPVTTILGFPLTGVCPDHKHKGI